MRNILYKDNSWEEFNIYLEGRLQDLHDKKIKVSTIISQDFESRYWNKPDELIDVFSEIESNEKFVSIKKYLERCVEYMNEKVIEIKQHNIQVEESREWKRMNRWEIPTMNGVIEDFLRASPITKEILPKNEYAAKKRLLRKKIGFKELAWNILSDFDERKQYDLINQIWPSELLVLQEFAPDFFKDDYVIFKVTRWEKVNNFVNKIKIEAIESTIEWVINKSYDLEKFESIEELAKKYNILIIPLRGRWGIADRMITDSFNAISISYYNENKYSLNYYNPSDPISVMDNDFETLLLSTIWWRGSIPTRGRWRAGTCVITHKAVKDWVYWAHYDQYSDHPREEFIRFN